MTSNVASCTAKERAKTKWNEEYNTIQAIPILQTVEPCVGSDHSWCAPAPALVLFDRGNQQVGILGAFGEHFIMAWYTPDSRFVVATILLAYATVILSWEMWPNQGSFLISSKFRLRATAKRGSMKSTPM